MCIELANVIKKSNKKYDRILAIGRGGLIPGTILSHLLNIDMAVIMTKNFVYSHNKEAQSDKLLMSQFAIIHKLAGYYNKDEDVNKLNSFGEVINNVLIVDDIFDSGKTIQEVNNATKLTGWKTDVAVLVAKKSHMLMLVKYYIADVELDEWVLFPWENDKK